jgi:hypothetical protein
MEIYNTEYRLKSLASLLCVMMLFQKYVVNEQPVLERKTYLAPKADIRVKTQTFLEKNETFLKEIDSDDISKNYKIVDRTIDLAIKILSDSLNDVGGRQFLKEIAIAESRLGSDPRHIRYEGNAGRGIWQLDKIGFEETKNISSHPNLKIYHERLKKYGIDWDKVEWNDCNKPLYGAIAARLLILSKPFKISKNRQIRAKQWKEHYNSNKGKGTPIKYLAKVKNIYAMLD